MNITLLLWLIPTAVAIVLMYAITLAEVLWHRRVIWSEVAVGLLLAGGFFIFGTNYGILAQVLLAVVQAWLLLLAGRLAFGRLPIEFMRPSTRLNCLLGMLGIALIIVYSVFSLQLQVLLLSLSCTIGVAFLAQLGWTFKHYRLRKIGDLKRLPTVTLAIPARNETHAMDDCLAAAIASDYPRLEILVLDDCSQDKTPELIRSFAHDGVRFIQGDVPAEGWLGKNQAFEELADQALGEYIIFAGVDTHLAPQSISKLVAYALSNKVAMVSVLPTRREGLHLGTILPQLRYYWQIVFPITKRRVPVASPCWLIKKDALHQLGGFASVRHKILPEGTFARDLFGVDMYRFLISNDELGITTAKKWSSQNESALRLLYPTFKRQPFYLLAACLLLVGLLIYPFVYLVQAMATQQFELGFWLSVVAIILFMLSYALVIVRTHPKTWSITLVCLPLALVQEVILLIVSMLEYEFGIVNWKGRNVCYPVIKHLSFAEQLARR